MTSRMISQKMYTEIMDRTAARSRDLAYMVRPQAADRRIARMDTLEFFADYDRCEDGLIRRRRGMVGDEIMTATVKSYAGELLVTFWQAERKHSRRFLIDAIGTYFMEANGRAIEIGDNNKYWVALNAIWTARAH